MTQQLDLDVVRRCALRWPLTAALDRVATEKSPVLRCVIVAKVLDPTQDDPTLGDLSAQAVGMLRDEAKRRHSGVAPAMPALTQLRPAPRSAQSKERNLA